MRDEVETGIVEYYLKHVELQPTLEQLAGPITSTCSVTISDRSSVRETETDSEDYLLGLAHGKGIVIGRKEGGGTEYLDPRFQPTQFMPGNGQRVVVDCCGTEDICVSRGHFTLIGSPVGIIFVNGVPRRGGGIRPPLNGTDLIEPEQRKILAEEHIVVKPGESIKIRLPNRVQVLISGTT
jgi:hypothetical protein